MNVTDKEIQKALRIKRAVTEYFDNSNQTRIQAKQLMDFFIEKGIFTKNLKDGQPIRELLTKLDAAKLVYLIPQISFEMRGADKVWYFIKQTASENFEEKPGTDTPAETA